MIRLITLIFMAASLAACMATTKGPRNLNDALWEAHFAPEVNSEVASEVNSKVAASKVAPRLWEEETHR